MKVVRPLLPEDVDRELSLYFFRLRKAFKADPEGVAQRIMSMEGFSRCDKLTLLEYLQLGRTPDFVEFYLEKREHWKKHRWV